MFVQTLTMATRVLLKHWLYTLLSILSLALGMIVFLTDLALVEQARTMDEELTYHDQIYNFYGHWSKLDVPVNLMTTPKTADRLSVRFPQIEQVTRLIPYGEHVIQSKSFRQYEQVNLVDANFFQVFDYEFVAGDPKTALSDPNSAILSRAAAARYFEDEKAIGETIVLNDGRSFRISAIIDNLPPTSHFRSAFGNFNVTVSTQAYESSREGKFPFGGWGGDTSLTFAVVPKSLSTEELNRGLKTLVIDDWPDNYADILEIRARPIDTLLDDILRIGELSVIDVVFILGAIVLVVACINFTNLLITQNSSRAKEMALRKAIGSGRSFIIIQFLVEGLIISVTAVAIAAVAVAFLLEWLSTYNFPLSFEHLMNSRGATWLFLLAPLVTLLGGIYPAVKVSGIRPNEALGNNSSLNRHFGAIRTVIVAGQFVLAVSLLIGTVVTWTQQAYLQKLDLRYAQDQIIILNKIGYEKIQGRFPNLKSALENTEGVLAIAASNRVPSEQSYTNSMVMEPGDNPDDYRMLTDASLGPGFFDLYNIDLIAGRQLSNDFVNDVVKLEQNISDLTHGNIVINEGAVDRMGWLSPEAAVGKVILSGNPYEPDEQTRLTVVGVVEDAALRVNEGKVDPMMFFSAESLMSKVSIKISTQDTEGVIARIDDVWNEVYPDYPIQRQFLDEKFEVAYRQSTTNKWVLAFSCTFALVISALGLFGMSGHLAKIRVREIGVRKVMGATVTRIVGLLVWDFSKPVLLANLLAWPITYLAMRSYLDGYAERIALSPMYFLGAGSAALLIAWLVVTFHVIRAARTHPANALRYE